MSTRGLTSGEKSMLYGTFGNSLDYDKVVIKTDFLRDWPLF